MIESNINYKPYKDTLETDGTVETYDGKDEKDVMEYLIREMVKAALKKMSIESLWPKLKKVTGKDCKQLWIQKGGSIINKVVNMLAANDILEDVAITMHLSADDWLLYNVILVHENINVINCSELPQCINVLYKLVQEYEVENLVGDELAEAWIRLTLQYNNGGRRCSPMLLQLRWYQLKEMSRRQVYKPAQRQVPEKTKMLHSIAIKFQKIITQPFPTWDALIKENRVILHEHFVKIFNQQEEWKELKAHKEWSFQIDQDISVIPAHISGDNFKSISNDNIAKELDFDDVLEKKPALPNNYNNDSLKQNCDDIDPKLVMESKVYTKKLECMNIFKHMDYTYVKDKKVIEYATLESKPIFKRVSKNKYVSRFQDEMLLGHKIINNQSNDDIRKIICDKPYSAIKANSWLLQKPKNLKYNPIKLRKNPDFNVQLKKLTPAFFSSTRNITLFQECKPLTVDLHKEFEKKIINGTIFVEDLKNTTTAKKRKYSRSTKTVHDTNDISIAVPVNIEDTEIQTLCERRKIINLPNIDQIRKFNQRLLTAEITPIRNDSKLGSVGSSKQSDITEPFQEFLFIPCTAADRITQNKKEESLEPDTLYVNNIMHKAPNKTWDEDNSSKDPVDP